MGGKAGDKGLPLLLRFRFALLLFLCYLCFFSLLPLFLFFLLSLCLSFLSFFTFKWDGEWRGRMHVNKHMGLVMIFFFFFFGRVGEHERKMIR